MGHSERAHALLSASSASRWMTCTPSAKLEEQFPDTTSDSAREGTIAHELAEMKLQNYFYTKEFSKTKLTRGTNKLKKEELWQDEMLGYIDSYLDYVKLVALSAPTAPYVVVEKKVEFTQWVPEGFGTADCIIIYGDTIHVIDFKYGKGVPVSAEHNPQMMLYALGAFQTYGFLYPIKNVRMSIFQPRLDNLSEWDCTMDDLHAFGETIKEKALLAMNGDGDFHPSTSACRFCRARAQCRARAEENVRLAFMTDKKPPLISNEEVGNFLQQGEDVAKWLEDLKVYALAECLAGKEVPGWKAVEGRGSREWTDMDVAFAVLTKGGVTAEEMLWEKKPLTLAQVEKLIGKKDFQDAVGEYVVKKPGKPALVKESDKREAITNKVTAEEAFKS